MYIPFGEDVAIHLNIFNSASPKDASCLVWLKLAWWFWRKRFLNFVNAFLLFCYHLPLEKGVALHLNKFNSPSPKDASCLVWLKLALWFWRRRFLNFANAFLLFCYHHPLEKGVPLHLNKVEFPTIKDALCQDLVEIGPMVLRKR